MYTVRQIKDDQPKDWIVFIHGFGGSQKTWNKQIDGYIDDFHVLLLNLHENEEDVLTVEDVFSKIEGTLIHYGIEKAHFMGASFGAVLAVGFSHHYPQRVKSLVLGGGIAGFDRRTRLLLTLAKWLKNRVPYMWLYGFFAFVIMPRKNHKLARGIFVREARKMQGQAFRKWVDFVVATVKKDFTPQVQTLYIMGDQDHLFLKPVIHSSRIHQNMQVAIIPSCGHVCFIEKANEYLHIAKSFFVNNL